MQKVPASAVQDRSIVRKKAQPWVTAILLLASWPVLTGEVWISVDTGHRSLNVMEGERVVRVFDDISLGRSGVTNEKQTHDHKTPLGSYRVRRINDQSRFHLYFGFDYPNLEQAKLAFKAGRISYEQLKAIRKAHYLGQEPPSDTALGGMIGIHGIGNGDVRVHEEFNWTDGCIALTNEEVDELAAWIRLGTRVEVY